MKIVLIEDNRFHRKTLIDLVNSQLKNFKKEFIQGDKRL